MFEIIVLFKLGRSIAARSRERGMHGTPAVFLLLGLWIAGEIVGALIGFAACYALFGTEESNVVIVYAAAIVGAIIGAVKAFRIIDARSVKVEEARPSDGQDGAILGLTKFPEP